MKKSIFRMLFLLLPVLTQAQEKTFPRSQLTFAPLLKIKYEQSIHHLFSVGGILQVYPGARYQVQNGVQVHPIFRYYPKGTTANGLYLQARGSVGYHNVQMFYFSESGNLPSHSGLPRTYSFAAVGGGIDIGMRFFTGKFRGGAIDICFGFNYYPFPAHIPRVLTESGKTLYAADAMYIDQGLGSKLVKVGAGRWKGFWGPGYGLFDFVSFGFSF